jgi:WD40 repeat protein
MATNSVFTCHVLNTQTGSILATLNNHDFSINIIRINDKYIVVSDKSNIICVYSKTNYLLICKIPVYRLKVSSTDGYFDHFTSLDLFDNTIIVGTRHLPQYYDAESGFFLGNCRGLKEQPPREYMGIIFV